MVINRAYLMNYEERDQKGLSLISQVAESHIDTMIKDQFSRTNKCNGLRMELTMCCRSEDWLKAMNGQTGSKLLS